MNVFKALKTRGVAWLWKHTPNCAEMSRLASLSFEQPPSPGMRLRMRLHYLICVWCERYRKQLAFLRRAIQQDPEQLNQSAPARLSDEARERLKRSLRRDRNA